MAQERNNTQNQGIMHLRAGQTQMVVCGNRRAIMFLSANEFGDLPEASRCIKCQPAFTKWQKRAA
jgi:DNA-directed RNA polymerase subunit M/transcription elongation factor TFIIS